MRKIIFSFTLFLALWAMICPGWAYSVAETTPQYFNGHYYMAVSGKFTWNEAKEATQAISLPGDVIGNFSANLASLTSEDENSFVWNSLGVNLKHYWLGGYQEPAATEPAGGWRWVDGELWQFSKWFTPAEPNNAGGKQHYLSFWSGPNGLWMDMREDWGGIKGFVVEFAPSPVPVPAPVLLLASGLFGLLAIRRGSRN